MDANHARLDQLPERQSVDLEALIASIAQVLRETAFQNGKLVAPRHLDQIAEQEARSFLAFVETGDEEAVHQRGRQIAREGLGHRPVLMMTETLRGNGHEHLNATDRAVSAYVMALLEGYMLGREHHLLQEQDRTFEALLRTRDQAPEQ